MPKKMPDGAPEFGFALFDGPVAQALADLSMTVPTGRPTKEREVGTCRTADVVLMNVTRLKNGSVHDVAITVPKHLHVDPPLAAL